MCLFLLEDHRHFCSGSSTLVVHTVHSKPWAWHSEEERNSLDTVHALKKTQSTEEKQPPSPAIHSFSRHVLRIDCTPGTDVRAKALERSRSGLRSESRPDDEQNTEWAPRTMQVNEPKERCSQRPGYPQQRVAHCPLTWQGAPAPLLIMFWHQRKWIKRLTETRAPHSESPWGVFWAKPELSGRVECLFIALMKRRATSNSDPKETIKLGIPMSHTVRRKNKTRLRTQDDGALDHPVSLPRPHGFFQFC